MEDRCKGMLGGGLDKYSVKPGDKSKGSWFFNSCRFKLHFLNESTDPEQGPLF